ncbi:MAG: hypothetical protein SGARI_002865 [Bacillariaceae sp.]
MPVAPPVFLPPVIAPVAVPTTPVPTPDVTVTISPIENQPVAPIPPPSDAPVADPTSPPISGPPTVQMVIESVALQGGSEFDDPSSYQSQALARTEEQIGIETLSDAKIIQYYALYTIYTATNGVSNEIIEAEGITNIPDWIVAAGWESNNVDPCAGQWFGVSCQGDQVSDIDLFSNLLTGEFPPEVTLLAADGPRSTGAGAIRRLDLFDNMLLSNGGDNTWWQFLGSSFVSC